MLSNQKIVLSKCEKEEHFFLCEGPMQTRVIPDIDSHSFDTEQQP